MKNMLCTTKQVKYFQIIEWILYFCLCGLSVIFMYGVLDKFFSGKTSFSQSEESIKELPTIMICFSKPNLSQSEYEYRSDFKIEYRLNDRNWRPETTFLKEGTNKLFGEILWLQKVATQFQGYCYNLTSVLTNKYMMKQLTEIMIYFNESIIEENLPTNLKIYITSEKNSYGISFSDWKNGKVMKASVAPNMFKGINLTPEQHNYMTMNSRCSNDPYYECLARLIFMNLKGSKCSPFSLPSLPVCKENDNIWESEFFYVLQNVSDQCTTKLCTILEYSGEETFYEAIPDLVKKATFGFSYQISSNATKLYDEYLIYDAINTIASVGGTLGMCIGFSFTGLISSTINIFKEKIERKKLHKSEGKNGFSKNTIAIKNRGKQNETSHIKEYLRNEKCIEERLDEKVQQLEKRLAKKLEEKLVEGKF